MAKKIPSGSSKILKAIKELIDLGDNAALKKASVLKNAHEALQKEIKGRATKTASRSTRAAKEKGTERLLRQKARKLSESRVETGGKNWKKRVKELYGSPPSWMKRPHGHHVVYRNGNKAAQPFVEQSQAILRHFGIDPITSKHNLIWAPNAGHSAANAKEVLQRLTDTMAAGGGRKEIEETLMKAGREVFDGWP